jgi:hypothetical protein
MSITYIAHDRRGERLSVCTENVHGSHCALCNGQRGESREKKRAEHHFESFTVLMDFTRKTCEKREERELESIKYKNRATDQGRKFEQRPRVQAQGPTGRAGFRSFMEQPK